MEKTILVKDKQLERERAEYTNQFLYMNDRVRKITDMFEKIKQ